MRFIDRFPALLASGFPDHGYARQKDLRRDHWRFSRHGRVSLLATCLQVRKRLLSQANCQGGLLDSESRFSAAGAHPFPQYCCKTKGCLQLIPQSKYCN
jgi:hypothetical protein